MLFDLSHVTIGADPEIWVGKRNEIVSAHHLPFGTKAEPRKVAHGSVQVDGLALEVNVIPSFGKTAFISNIGNVLQDLESLVKKADPEMYLMVKPTAYFTPQYMESLPEEAKELGCSPDWDAYELRENERPDASGAFRTAGGHIHVGWGDDFNVNSLEHLALCADVAKQMDYTVGLYSLEFDMDEQRRSLYGKAGAFRPKPYGMEYRVLSPLWLMNVRHTGMVFDGTMKALRMLNDGVKLDDTYEGLARECINSSRREWRKDYPEMEKAIA